MTHHINTVKQHVDTVKHHEAIIMEVEGRHDLLNLLVEPVCIYSKSQCPQCHWRRIKAACSCCSTRMPATCCWGGSERCWGSLNNVSCSGSDVCMAQLLCMIMNLCRNRCCMLMAFGNKLPYYY